MSQRANVQMSSSGVSSRSAVTLPEQLRAILEIRRRTDLVAPTDLDATLARIPFFRRGGTPPNPHPTSSSNATHQQPANHGPRRQPNSNGPPSFRCGPTVTQSPTSAGSTLNGNRFMALANCNAPDGWRHSEGTRGSTEEEGFETWTGGRRGKRGGAGTGGSSSSSARTAEFRPASHHASNASGVARAPSSATSGTPGTSGTYTSSAPTSASTSTSTGSEVVTSDGPRVSTAWKSSRYQSVETKIATESIEERIMGKIRAKINKIGESTYEATKAFMQQILDSGETGFLEEFMQWVFQKAAMEPAFCGLYARLLHELADEFGHLRTEMQSRFRNYTRVFVEAKNTPDVGTADYSAFVEAQSQKKFRRGYSQFVAELAKLGEIPAEDFRILVEQIVLSIRSSVELEENKVLCEELVDCLMTMCMACGKTILSSTRWIGGYLKELDAVAKAPRTEVPGLTNKARFGLMDLQDAHRSGWRV